jgi:hypothetical protein
MASFFARRPAVETDPTDRVIPLHFFESSALVQGNNMAVSLVFDDVLDPEVLRRSLEDLVRRPGWERLGGRLRKNVRLTDCSSEELPLAHNLLADSCAMCRVELWRDRMAHP